MKGLDTEIRPSHPTLLLRTTNVLTFALLVAVSVAAQTSALGSSDLEISDKFRTPLTPASWAFTIWGAIFGLQALGVVFQALPHGYTSDGMKQRYVNGIGYLWQLSWVAEIAWQLLFQLESPLGFMLCVVCLAVAVAALGRTLFNMYRLKEAHGSLSNVLLYVAFFLPTSISAAWLSCGAAMAALMVPTALHHTAYLDLLGVALLAIVTALGLAVVQRYRDSAFGLTLVWAMVAIYGRQTSALIRVASLACICVTTLAAIFSMLRRKTPGGQTELADVRQPLSRINTV